LKYGLIGSPVLSTPGRLHQQGWEEAMKILLLSASLFMMAGAAAADENSNAEQELLKIREAMSNDFMAALAKGNVATAVNEHYTVDVVYKSLCPNEPPAIGRDTYLKRVESAVKAGAFRDYVSKPDEAHLLSEDRGWTTGTFTFTVNDKDGKPLQARGHWMDMLQRQGKVWMVSFLAVARAPCT
jgi:hypothetical protein